MLFETQISRLFFNAIPNPFIAWRIGLESLFSVLVLRNAGAFFDSKNFWQSVQNDVEFELRRSEFASDLWKQRSQVGILRACFLLSGLLPHDMD